MKLALILTLFTFLYSCSNKKAHDKEVNHAAMTSTQSSELANESDFILTDPGAQNSDPTVVSNSEIQPVKADEMPVATASEPPKQNIVLEEHVNQATPSEVSPITSQIKKYKLEKGETLMMMAFKIYGDYDKWKEIKKLNEHKLKKGLRANRELDYYAPETEFVWNPVGNPHLIQPGETLGKISEAELGTKKKWKTIYNNNKPLIKNPNLIFAGFTVYVPQGSRQTASEKN